MREWWARIRARPRLERDAIALPSKLWLPPELWQHIAGFLPLSSQTSLVFSCRTFACHLGTTAWRRLREDLEKLLDFLLLLDY